MNTKIKILFLLKLPPPNTGATYVNKLVYESSLYNQLFKLNKISVSYSGSVRELGKFGIGKIKIYFATVYKFLLYLFFDKPLFVYFQPSLFGLTFLRDLTFLLISRLFGIRVLCHLHGKGIANYSKKSIFFNYLYKIGFSNQFVIVLSENQIKDIAFVKPKKIYVLPNGVPSIITEDLHITSTKSEIYNFLFLSNLLISKGIYDLLNAVKILLVFKKNFVVNIVGGEGDIPIDELRLFLIENNLSKNVIIHGPKYGDDKVQFYKKADALIFPTRNDAFGLVILEAMQFSLPIISTFEGAIPSLIQNNETGFLVSPGDVQAIAANMSFLIENPEVGMQMGEKGKINFHKKYTLDIFEKNLEGIFFDVTNIIQHAQ